MSRLLERLLAARLRRDLEERFSAPWHAADAEMHAIERAIFRLPTDPPGGGGAVSGPTSIQTHRRGGDPPDCERERAG